MTFIASELLVCSSDKTQEQLLVLVFTSKDIRNESDPLGLVRILTDVYGQPMVEETVRMDPQHQATPEDRLSLLN